VNGTTEGTRPSDEKESDGEDPEPPKPPDPFHVPSYRHLLQFPDMPTSTRTTPSGKRDITVPIIDAIIVPTRRPAEQITSAVELALRARCQLVTLYTDSVPPGLAPILARLDPDMATSLTLPSGGRHHLLDLAADLPQTVVSSAALDISRKRNLGLIIGRACGWTRMLFLDDDIRKLSVAKLSSAAALLDKYPVVGLQVNKYPDASVVGHARRLTGRRQEPFISGGSLLVNPQLLNGFFPPTYHEDWLCIVNHLRRGQVAIGGAVGQVPYRPFTTPERARLEEFGDILLSGLLWVVHAGDGNSVIADREYWREAKTSHFWEEILSQRAALLESIASRLGRLNPDPLPSLEAAQQRCRELSPGEFVSFTDKWLANLAIWGARLSFLPEVETVRRALAEIGLAHPARGQAPARKPRWTGGFVGRPITEPAPVPAAAVREACVSGS